MGMESYKLGKEGEEIAENYLIQQGYQIIERNFHSRQGEVDIIARDRDSLVFVEVKSYSYRSYGSPVGAIRKAKKQSLIHAAQTYLYKKNIQDTYSRFDVIAIYKKDSGEQLIEHYRDAFYIN
jgi:putative endonuclease